MWSLFNFQTLSIPISYHNFQTQFRQPNLTQSIANTHRTPMPSHHHHNPAARRKTDRWPNTFPSHTESHSADIAGPAPYQLQNAFPPYILARRCYHRCRNRIRRRTQTGAECSAGCASSETAASDSRTRRPWMADVSGRLLGKLMKNQHQNRREKANKRVLSLEYHTRKKPRAFAIQSRAYHVVTKCFQYYITCRQHKHAR